MKLACSVAILAFLTFVGRSAVGQPPPADAPPAALVEEVRGIRQALDRLIALQEAQSRIELMLKRIEVQERRLDPIEERLRWAEAGLLEVEDSLKSLERLREQNETQLQEEIRNSTDAPHSDTRRMLTDIQRSRDAQTERQKEALLRVRELENELAARRKAIAILDEALLELLGSDRELSLPSDSSRSDPPNS